MPRCSLLEQVQDEYIRKKHQPWGKGRQERPGEHVTGQVPLILASPFLTCCTDFKARAKVPSYTHEPVTAVKVTGTSIASKGALVHP